MADSYLVPRGMVYVITCRLTCKVLGGGGGGGAYIDFAFNILLIQHFR